MFISTTEKAKIEVRLQSLEVCIDNLMAAVRALQAPPVPVKKPKRILTEAQKISRREYMRKWKAKKAAEGVKA